MTGRTPAVLPRGSRIARSGAEVRTPPDALAGRVWALLAEQPTLPVLVERLRGDDVRPEQLAEDVTRLLARWHAMGAIAWR